MEALLLYKLLIMKNSNKINSVILKAKQTIAEYEKVVKSIDAKLEENIVVDTPLNETSYSKKQAIARNKMLRKMRQSGNKAFHKMV